MPRRFPAAVLAYCAVLGGLAGCNKKEAASEVSLGTAASSLAPSPSPATAGDGVRFRVGEGSKVLFDMPAPKERIKGEVATVTGLLEVVPAHLEQTRGDVKADLTTLSTHTFDDPGKNASQSAHARTWLEVGDVADAPTREANRHAVFAIRKVIDLSAQDLATVAFQKDERGAFRSVTLKAEGEFLCHGRKVPKTAALEVRFRYPSEASGARPSALEIRTREPLRVVLAEHDVKPRDKVGKIAQEAFHVLGTKVADVASISLDLRAAADSPSP